MVVFFLRFELWNSKEVQHDAVGCGNLFHYREFHSEIDTRLTIYVTIVELTIVDSSVLHPPGLKSLIFLGHMFRKIGLRL